MDCIAPGLWPLRAQPLQCCAAAQLDSLARQSAIHPPGYRAPDASNRTECNGSYTLHQKRPFFTVYFLLRSYLAHLVELLSNKPKLTLGQGDACTCYLQPMHAACRMATIALHDTAKLQNVTPSPTFQVSAQ